jgi:3-hydroxyacyl-[acyl-carrier-protein] dehydratase
MMTKSPQHLVPSSLDTKKIVNILPHRYPFLLVDQITELDLDKGTIVGKKNLTINEAFFQGHFPGAPLMPGVLILEALAQTGGILVHLRDGRQKVAILLGVNSAKFRRPVKPGDVLILKASVIHLSSKGGKVAAEAFVDDVLVAESELSFALVEKDQI